jgi:hypothetical protein
MIPGPTGYSPAWEGCTAPGCGTQETSTVDGVHGRRCDKHPPMFSPELAVQLAVNMSPDAALAYCRAGLS